MYLRLLNASIRCLSIWKFLNYGLEFRGIVLLIILEPFSDFWIFFNNLIRAPLFVTVYCHCLLTGVTLVLLQFLVGQSQGFFQ